jgi:phage terminase large subunit-like protein
VELSSEQRKELGRLAQEELKRRAALYQPYDKQREFHALGLKKRERVLSAGNQNGKTTAGAAEVSFHLTGKYPDWWQGRRFTKPVKWWVGAVDFNSLRDGPQFKLLGDIKGGFAGGLIPAESITKVYPLQGVAEGVALARIRHVSGGESIVGFKTYTMGRARWQGASQDGVWFDEEPPRDVYSEGLSRTNATGGLVFMTFTPLNGMTELVFKFWKDPSASQSLTTMGLKDALHIPEERRQEIIDSYPEHEREARVNGVPSVGSGKVFTIGRDRIEYDGIKIQPHWPRIIGMDFGWEHPTAAAWMAWDRDTDTVYVYDVYRQSQANAQTNGVNILRKSRNVRIPVAWPHDGYQHDKGSGMQLAELYRNVGLNMLQEHAKFSDGSNGVEAGVMWMLDRMHAGTLKVASHLEEWFEEFDFYHREDGKIVKLKDDLLSATRYGLMCLRMAELDRSGYEDETDVGAGVLTM